MEVIPKQARPFMPFSLEVKLSSLPPQDLGTQMFDLLFVVLFCNCF